MESRTKRIFLIALASSLPALSIAETVLPGYDEPEDEGLDSIVLPDLQRRTIDESDIDTEDFEIGGFGGVMNVEDFGSNPVAGVRLAYHATEDFFMEASYGFTETSETSFEKLSGSAQLIPDDDRELTYYNLSVGYNIFPGEVFIGDDFAFNTTLYLIGGAGNTDFAGDSFFTYNFGLGIRFFATDWFSLHFDVRDHVFNTDLLGAEETTHNLESHISATLFF